MTLTFTFVGDVSFARDIKDHYDTKNYANIFKNTKNVLTQTDVLMLNLECAFDNAAHTYGNNISLIAHDKALNEALPSLITDTNHLVISLANNHALDAGPKNLSNTINTIESLKGPRIVGICNGCLSTKKDGKCEDIKPNKDYTSTILEIQGTKIGFIAFSQWFPVFVNPKMVKQRKQERNKEKDLIPCLMYGPSTIHTDFLANIMKDIRKRVDILITYVHFREEYHLEPNKLQIEICDTLTKLGADLVIGSGPHVVQDIREINGVPCAMSLGNFVFDSHVHKRDTRKSLILQTRFHPQNGSWSLKKYDCTIDRHGTPKIVKRGKWEDFIEYQEVVPEITLLEFLEDFEDTFEKEKGWGKKRFGNLKKQNVDTIEKFGEILAGKGVNEKVGEKYTLKTIQELREHWEWYKVLQVLMFLKEKINKESDWVYDVALYLREQEIDNLGKLKMGLKCRDEKICDYFTEEMLNVLRRKVYKYK